MVRNRTFEPNAALSTVVDLFASKGYAETSMEDIVRATGVSRYGLYGTFGNKRDLFEQALERYAESMGKRSFVRLTEPGASLADIRKIFDDRVDDMCCPDISKGCLFIHTAMELAPQDEDLKGVLQKFMKRMARAFAAGLESARALGEVRDDLDTRQAGEYLTSAMFGLAVLGRTGFDKAVLGRVVETTLDALRP